MKNIWPIFAGILLIGVVSLSWQYLGRYAALCGLFVLIATPVVTFIVQGRKARLLAFAGLVAGAVTGLALGYFVGPLISEAMHGPTPVEYNIRIDLVMWWCLFASFTASCFSAVAGMYGRRRSNI